MAKLLTKNAFRSLGLYPAARHVNRQLTQYLQNRSTAIEGKRRRIARYGNRVSFFRPFIAANDLVFDIGAFHGNWTQAFLDLGARVIACEPQVDLVRELRKRQSARVTKGRLTVVDCAVGGARGTATLYVREFRGTSGLVEHWHPSYRIEIVATVDVITLDDLIDKYGVPKYCKIDVEGYESEVFKGLTKRIPMISFEYHMLAERPIETTVTCLNYLSRLGTLSLNVTPAENQSFLFNEWVSCDFFLDFFIHHLKNLAGFEEYGDIFVRID